MKLLVSFLILLFISCERNSHLSEEILHVSKEHNFPYAKTLEKAKSGDPASIELMIRFYDKTDAGFSFSHSFYMYEILESIGDEKFSNILSKQDKKLIKWNLGWLKDRNNSLYQKYPALKKLIKN